MNKTNVKKLIFEGEGVTVDFKKTITSCEKIARTMVSFANNKGGKLLIGVTDDGTIKGVKSDDEERYMITKAAHFFRGRRLNLFLKRYILMINWYSL
ncbi:AlbA family DNA-binding domain-containing protein [Mucilaginibacter sp. P25]|uniref:AlbA family DNA-binding domain-containing protein n=1 Tax=unclassified Mucilaginibacter TaxID=2617802 RepID=UPI003D67B7A0